MLLGHYYAYIMLVVLGMSVAVHALQRVFPPSAVILAAAWVLGIASVACHVRVHARCLCERCIRAAPALDPQRAVRRWRLALWSAHKPVLSLCLLAAAVALILAQGLWKSDVFAYTGTALAASCFGWQYLVDHHHRRLTPWCPRCHWGGSGDSGERSPVPESPASR